MPELAAQPGVQRRLASDAGAELESSSAVSVNIVKFDGQSTTRTVAPSYPHKPKAVANVKRGLEAILQSETSLYTPQTRSRWQLDDNGYTIHKHIRTLGGRDQRKWVTIQSRIDLATNELHHDPHILVNPLVTTISLTTHVPPGLSMKDIKLARVIDEILVAELKNEDARDGDKNNQQGYIDAINANISKNNEVIEEARRSCDCVRS